MVDVRALEATDNAMVWAEAWCEVAREIEQADDGRVVIDAGWMVGWFANAMAAAERQAIVRARARTEDPDFVVLPRAALFEFFGEMALPPWPDGKGGQFGSNINCAPIASKISEWVDGHDVSHLVTS
jgi:hypothetical protein